MMTLMHRWSPDYQKEVYYCKKNNLQMTSNSNSSIYKAALSPFLEGALGWKLELEHPKKIHNIVNLILKWHSCTLPGKEAILFLVWNR